jgi:FG-GAP-like repeat
VAHGIEMTIKSFNEDLKKTGETSTRTVVVDMTLPTPRKTGAFSTTLLNMGALNPQDVTHGSLQTLKINREFNLEPKPFIDSLPRPVNLQEVDLNDDGRLDYLICGYGNFTGGLFALFKQANGTFEKITLRNLPGSIQAMTGDFNGDQRIDVLALFAQGDEGLFLYEQQQDGSFHEKNLLRFSPVAGSISFDLADFNGDSIPDVLYSCGDNADYSKILKPYHGVYVYINDGRWNLKQSYFFPINGCFKAVARDFDLDGDTDIAAISYFSDYKRRPEEGFVYLENKGHFLFDAFTLPNPSLGRWLTMDANDIDGDGDVDIVLGNMSIGPSNGPPNFAWRQGPAFVLLQNKTKIGSTRK